MRVRTAASFAVAAVVLAGALAPAQAAVRKPKPITKTWSVTLAPLPDATEATACTSAARTASVNMASETLKVTGPGILSVKMTGFAGDWDMAVSSASGSRLSEGGGTSTGSGAPATDGVETMKYKNKKAQTLSIDVCNFAGSPQATVTYTYTYN
jgi:hypothetical protein